MTKGDRERRALLLRARQGDWRAADQLLGLLMRLRAYQALVDLAAEEIGRAHGLPWDPTRARWLCQVHNAAHDRLAAE